MKYYKKKNYRYEYFITIYLYWYFTINNTALYKRHASAPYSINIREKIGLFCNYIKILDRMVEIFNNFYLILSLLIFRYNMLIAIIITLYFLSCIPSYIRAILGKFVFTHIYFSQMLFNYICFCLLGSYNNGRREYLVVTYFGVIGW